MRGLHNVIGITTPKPEDEVKIVLLWIGVVVFLFAGTALLGYVLITQIASSR